MAGKRANKATQSEKLYPEGWWTDPTHEIDPSLWPVYADFRNFLFIVWKHVLPLSGGPSPIQYDIAEYLQNAPKRSVIEAFRGIGKSWVTSAYVLWRLLRDPAINILVVSASKDRSDAFTTFTLRLIFEIELLHHLRPKQGQRQSMVAFDVGPAPPAHAPSVKSVGITGQLAGSRADLIVADDVEVLNNSVTQTMRDKLLELIKEFDAILKPGPDSEIKYLGTPQSEQSIYNTLPDRGYEVRIWPARVPSETLVSRYGSRMAPFIADLLTNGAPEGSPTDKRFSDADLKERELSYGRAGFALQFMLDTTLADIDKFPLKLSDLIIMPVPKSMAPVKIEWTSDPRNIVSDVPNVGLPGDRLHRPLFFSKEEHWAPWDGTVLAIDPSGRGKDETGWAVVKFCQGTLWCPAAGGFLGGYDKETLQALAVIAKTHDVNTIIVEPNFGDGMFRQLLEPVVARVHPCTIEDSERAKAQKEMRIIDVLEPVMMQHKLVMDPQVLRQDYSSVGDRPGEDAPRYRLGHQLTRITRDRGALVRDDRVDALAMAVAYWVEYMNRDTAKAHVERKEVLVDQMLEKFREAVLGPRDEEAYGNSVF